MSFSQADSEQQEQRFNEVVAAYLEAVDAGATPDQQEWLARFPEFAAQLSDFFAARESIDRFGLALPAPPPPDIPPGSVRQFGDYELLAKLGHGGMGVIYKARHKTLNRVVALKMLRANQLALGLDLPRFRKEAEAAALLDHPHIVPIYDVGEHDGQPYFSMKLIEGGSLAEAVLRDPESGLSKEASRRAAQWVATVARAVHHAHQRGVLHRDLKPSNILLDQDNQPHVTDFGLSRRVTSTETPCADASLTQSGQIVGTPGYMAPEQASGKKGAVTTATDVYGLGAVLYALLARRPPFRGETVLDTLAQVKEREPEQPSGINRRVDRDLETICLKCLQKEPERRYASAQALAEDLQRWLAGKPIHARPINRTARLWRWCRRNRAIAAATALATLLLLAGLVGLLVGILLIAHEQAQTKAALDQAQEQRRLAEERELEVRRQLYVADINRAARSWGSVDTRQLLALLDRHTPAPGQEDLRSFAWYYLQRLCQGQTEPRCTLQDNSGEVYCVAFSPNGQLVATCGQDGNVRLWNPSTGQLQAEFRAHANEVNWLAFSPDGQTLATAGDDGAVRLWDRATGQERSRLTPAVKVACVAFSPDGRMLAAGLDDGKLLRWDLPSVRPQPAIAAHLKRIAFVGFSHDGTKLATAGCEGTAKVWEASAGRLGSDFRGFVGNYGFCALALAQHNPWLATCASDGELVLWSTITGLPSLSLRGHQGGSESVAFNADDRLLASAGDDATVRLWEIPSGKLRNLLAGHAGRVWCVAFSPDGRTLATAGKDGTVKLWDPEQRYDCQVLHADGAIVYALTFAPDGKLLATSSYDGGVRFWDTTTGRLQGQLPCKEALASMRFSPDGRSLACGYAGGVARLWDIARREERWSIKVGADGVRNLGFRPGGDMVMINHPYQKSPVRIWEVHPGLIPRLTAVVETKVETIGANEALSPDSNILAINSSSLGVQFWDLPGGHLRQGSYQPPGTDPCLAFSSDGARFAIAGESIDFWDVATGRLVTTTGVGHPGCRAMAFSPNGRTLASCSYGGTVKLWNVATGQELLTLECPNCRLMSVAFSPDGRALAAGGEVQNQKGECQLWFAADEPRPPQQTVIK